MTPHPDVLNPLALVLPKMTTTTRDLLVAELGTIIYDTTQDKLCYCVVAAAGATSWEILTGTGET